MEYADYSELKRRIEKLEQKYLPPFDSTATYTPEQEDDMRALRLLVHAEVEEFLEKLCELLSTELEKQCNSHPSNAALGSKIYRQWGKLAAQKSKHAISSNNGVKSNNIRSLFEPLGFGDDEFDAVSPVFLNKMNQFGTRRGDVAHKSALRATWAITAQGEKQLLDEVMSYIEIFCAAVHRQRLHGYF